MYYSRKYIREKFEQAKNDIEKVLDIYNEETDRIPEEEVQRVKANVKDKFESIINELYK